MTILLDTQIILWALIDETKLTVHEKEILTSTDHQIYCHPISFFEISLKYAVGKLELTGCTPDEIPKLMEDNGYLIATGDLRVMSSVHQLPMEKHRDPFDRLLVWHAIQNDLHFLSRDRKMPIYEKHGLKLI